MTKFGRRPGDNAENCLLSLVDSERDVKGEMTARAVGREVVERLVGSGKGREGLEAEVRGCVEAGDRRGSHWLSERSRRDVEKVLKYKSKEEVAAFVQNATQYAVSSEARG